MAAGETLKQTAVMRDCSVRKRAGCLSAEAECGRRVSAESAERRVNVKKAFSLHVQQRGDQLLTLKEKDLRSYGEIAYIASCPAHFGKLWHAASP